VHIAAAGIAARGLPGHDDRVRGRRADAGQALAEPEGRGVGEALLRRAVGEVERDSPMVPYGAGVAPDNHRS
jgi:hypothetical protein